jgi:hypothetical protein
MVHGVARALHDSLAAVVAGNGRVEAALNEAVGRHRRRRRGSSPLACTALGRPLPQALGAASATAAIVAAVIDEIVAETHFPFLSPPYFRTSHPFFFSLLRRIRKEVRFGLPALYICHNSLPTLTYSLTHTDARLRTQNCFLLEKEEEEIGRSPGSPLTGGRGSMTDPTSGSY